MSPISRRLAARNLRRSEAIRPTSKAGQDTLPESDLERSAIGAAIEKLQQCPKLPTNSCRSKNSWRALKRRSAVKRFNATKGYGFIQPDGATKDVFVHISAVERAGLSTLAEAAKVTFDIVDNRGKEAAENLRRK